MKSARALRYVLLCVMTALLLFLCCCREKGFDEFIYKSLALSRGTEIVVLGFEEGCDAAGTVRIPSEHNGLAVTMIGSDAFRECHLEAIVMEKIREIGPGAFCGCLHLTWVDLGTAERILERAFCDCISLKTVFIPSTVSYLGDSAFCGCFDLETVFFEGSPEYIAEHVFDETVTLRGQEGSAVEEYAKLHGLVFEAWRPGDAD